MKYISIFSIIFFVKDTKMCLQSFRKFYNLELVDKSENEEMIWCSEDIKISFVTLGIK